MGAGCVSFYTEQGILLQPQVFGMEGDESMLTYAMPQLLSQHYWQSHFPGITVYIGSNTDRFSNGNLGDAARASLTAIVAGEQMRLADIICHELGHLLGLPHDETPGNFMKGAQACPSRDEVARRSIGATSTSGARSCVFAVVVGFHIGTKMDDSCPQQSVPPLCAHDTPL